MAFWEIKRENGVLSALCHILYNIMETSKILKDYLLLFKFINFELISNESEPFHVFLMFFAGETTELL